MTQKERMLAGLPYKAWLDGLSEERMACRRKLHAFNLLPPDEEEQAQRLLRELLGKPGGTPGSTPPSTVTTAGTSRWGTTSLPTTTSPFWTWAR